jgi:2-dehydro-3-deoxygluconokinase
MPGKRFAAIGECMIELFQDGERSFSLGFGGDTLNMSLYLGRLAPALGLTVDYATALGDDPYSDSMLAWWRTEGIGTGLVRRIAGRLPGLYLIRTDAKGERSFYYFRRDAAAREMLAGDAGAALAARLAGYDIVYFSGITLSILDGPSRQLLFGSVDAARARGATILFDSNFRARGWPDKVEARAIIEAAARRADILLPTIGDEMALFGDADGEACVARLASYGAREIVVKRDARPALVWFEGRVAAVAPPEVARVVDTTAAGDSFNAGYLAARLAGRDPVAAARIGHTLAAAVIQHQGAAIPRAAMPALGLL